MRDSRASSDMLLDEVWASLPPGSDIVELEQQGEQLQASRCRIKGRTHELDGRLLIAEIESKKTQCRKLIKMLYHQYYFYHRST